MGLVMQCPHELQAGDVNCLLTVDELFPDVDIDVTGQWGASSMCLLAIMVTSRGTLICVCRIWHAVGNQHDVMWDYLAISI